MNLYDFTLDKLHINIEIRVNFNIRENFNMKKYQDQGAQIYNLSRA